MLNIEKLVWKLEILDFNFLVLVSNLRMPYRYIQILKWKLTAKRLNLERLKN